MEKSMSTVVFTLCLLVLLPALVCAQLTDKERLGELLYFDEDLSLNQNQACASCHWPTAGYADLLNAADPVTLPVSEGSVDGLFGGRNAPSAAYAAGSPKFALVAGVGYVGGQFWDGRANGLKAQAKGPFLNPVEMAMPSSADVLAAIADPDNPNLTDYRTLFSTVYQVNVDTFDQLNAKQVKTVYDYVADAIATYERSSVLNKFNSRYDAFLAGQASLTPFEATGKGLFDLHCSQCHPSEGMITAHQVTMPTVLSSFTYHNLGLPHNQNVLMIDNPRDLGLGGRDDIADPDEYGKFKTPTLRNIALTAPYGHNGYFATLEEMVAFLNDRSNYPPEVTDNLTDRVGNLGLTVDDEAAIVAFLKTLTDQ